MRDRGKELRTRGSRSRQTARHRDDNRRGSATTKAVVVFLY
jgi:hypothetical protein